MNKIAIQNTTDQDESEVLDKLKAGGTLRLDEPQYAKVWEIVFRTLEMSVALNASTTVDQIRQRLGEITGAKVDESTMVFVPFHTNFGRLIRIGKNVFINHDCTFLDLGGITIADDVMIGPKVSLITENHPIDPINRKAIILKPIVIKRNAWIGAAATILPGVTIGENSVVAAGAVVTADVPPNTIVGGVPARIIKAIGQES